MLTFPFPWRGRLAYDGELLGAVGGARRRRAARPGRSGEPAEVGVLASLYAGYLNPQFRVTASQLSAVINGFATILLFALIDPQLSVMTDDVVDGRIDEPTFRRTIVWISLSRLTGTVLAQLLFVPAAVAIAWIATQV